MSKNAAQKKAAPKAATPAIEWALEAAPTVPTVSRESEATPELEALGEWVKAAAAAAAKADDGRFAATVPAPFATYANGRAKAAAKAAQADGNARTSVTADGWKSTAPTTAAKAKAKKAKRTAKATVYTPATALANAIDRALPDGTGRRVRVAGGNANAIGDGSAVVFVNKAKAKKAAAKK